MDKLQQVLCSMYNKSYLSIVLVSEKCRWCYSKKKIYNKFSTENNMDLEEISEELQDLIEIKEMLISKVFTVMSVYRLHGEQYKYKGNVINFS